jgi:hypothetical protein
VRARAIAAGDAGFGTDPSRWGEWVADVQRPAEQYRGRYQLRLDESRGLILPPCPSGEQPAPEEIDDAVPPPLQVVRTAFRRRALLARVSCGQEPCTVTVTARLTVPAGAARVFRLRSRPADLAAGASRLVKLRFKPRLRRALRGARSAHARLRVLAVDAAGNATLARRGVGFAS